MLLLLLLLLLPSPHLVEIAVVRALDVLPEAGLGRGLEVALPADVPPRSRGHGLLPRRGRRGRVVEREGVDVVGCGGGRLGI